MARQYVHNKQQNKERKNERNVTVVRLKLVCETKIIVVGQ